MTLGKMALQLLSCLVLIAVGLSLYIVIIGQPVLRYSDRDWAVLCCMGIIGCLCTFRFGIERGFVAGLIGFVVIALISRNPNSWTEQPLFILLALVAVALGLLRHWWMFAGLLVFFAIGLLRSWTLAGLLAGILFLTQLSFRLVRLNSLQLLRPLQGPQEQWRLLWSFAALFAFIVFAFACFYYALYLQDPTGTFANIGLGEDGTTGALLIGDFIYQSILVMATVGPPYAPMNTAAMILVAAELIIQIAVMVVYLTLLFKVLSFKEHTRPEG